MRDVFRGLFASLLLIGLVQTAPATAQEVDTADNQEFLSEGEADKLQSQCSRYHRYPQYCERTYGCTYDNYRNRCVESRPTYRCSYYDNSPYQCNQLRECYYDRYYGRCLSRGGGGGDRVWVCTASDIGWEEHWGGHQGYGYSQYQATREALAVCERYHGQCRITNCRMQ